MLYKTKFPMGVHSSLDCALSPAVIRAASCSAAGPVAGSAANRAADAGQTSAKLLGELVVEPGPDARKAMLEEHQSKRARRDSGA